MIKNMQVSLYRQKLKRRGQKVLETKQLKKFAPTDIILWFVKTEKSDRLLKTVSKVKVPVLDENGNKVKEKYQAYYKSDKYAKAKWLKIVNTIKDENWNIKGVVVEKERVKTEVKEREKIKLTFKVMNGANKNDVKEAVKQLYGVNVEKVNIVKVPYKKRERRWLVRRAYVKAIVTLKEWEKMPNLDEVK